VGKKALIFAGVIFVGGLIYFNGQVADACTHGNCVHGWSSKYTQDEQNNSRMWFIGFPLLTFLIYIFFNSNKEEYLNANKEKKNLHSNNKKNKEPSNTEWRLDYSGTKPKFVEVDDDWNWERKKIRLKAEHKQAIQNHKETEQDARRKKTYKRLDAFIKKQEEK
jgi:hypothetical protein